MTEESNDIAAIYLAADAGDKTAESNDTNGLARCDAVMALIPRLASNPDIAWAFDEARRLARSAPPATATRQPWFRRPALTWSMVGVAATSVLAVALFVGTAGRPPAELLAPPRMTADIESRLAEIDPVMLIADGVPVDGRSIAVVPITGLDSLPGAGVAGTNAAVTAMYQRLAERLAATPGLYVIGPDMAAAYADTELTGEEIALYLNVRGVVQASADSDGQMVSLDLRFTDAAGDGTAIEQHFSAPMADIASIENDVMSSVLAALGSPQAVPEQAIP